MEIMHADHGNTDDITAIQRQKGEAESSERKEIFQYPRTLSPP